MPPRSLSDYRIGWICVKPENEAVAARAILDERYGYVTAKDDPNQYFGGRIGDHNVIIGCTGEAGLSGATYVATHMARSFSGIKLGFICGIGGGNPSKKNDIRLGDIVVGMPGSGHGGVGQYNSGQITANGLVPGVPHNRPPFFVTQAVKNRMTDLNEGLKWQDCLPKDRSSDTTITHLTDELHGGDETIRRPDGRGTKIFYGLIASGDLVVKCNKDRHALASQLADAENVLCFDMEAAGLVSKFPCLVVRGISDYCDQYKNNAWQMYASMVAAAYCKFVLQIIPAQDVADAPTVYQVTNGLSTRSECYTVRLGAVNTDVDRLAGRSIASVPRKSSSKIVFRPRSGSSTPHSSALQTRMREALRIANVDTFMIEDFARMFKVYDYPRHFRTIDGQRCPGTCDWLKQDEDFLWWTNTRASSMLCVSGELGSGKSVILTHAWNILREDTKSRGGSRSIFPTYSISGFQNQSATTAITIAIHQLLVAFPDSNTTAYRYDLNNISHPSQNTLPRNNDVSGRTTIRSVISLWNLFIHIVKDVPCASVAFIVDGINDWDTQERDTFLLLAYSTIKTSSQLKVLLSTRTELTNEQVKVKFLQWRSQCPEHFRYKDLTEAEDHLRKDIHTFIEFEVNNLGSRYSLTPSEQQQIQQVLTAENNGLFLPVTLRLGQLERTAKDGGDLMEQLRLLPQSLQTLYTKLLDQLYAIDSPIKAPVLLYLMYAKVPLSMKDLAFAINEHDARLRDLVPTEDYLKDEKLQHLKMLVASLGSLFKMRSDGSIVQFTHPSIKQFLIDTSTTSPGAVLQTPQQAQLQIAKTCIQLLIDNSAREYAMHTDDADKHAKLDKAMFDTPLLYYAMRFWSFHVLRATDASSVLDRELLGLVDNILRVWRTSTQSFRYKLLRYGGILPMCQNRDPLSLTSLELLSVLGMYAILRHGLGRISHLARNATPEALSALVLAIRAGHTPVVELLIDHYAITSLDNSIFKTVLEDSAWTNQPALLEKVMKLRRPRLDELLQALTTSFTTGDLQALDVLTADRSIFEERTKFGRTALHQLLINLSGVESHAAAQALAESTYLIEQGRIPVNWPDCFGFTALHYACWGRFTCKAILIAGLIEQGADPFATTRGGLLPLHFAARCSGDPEAVELLLELSESISRVWSKGQNTILHWAVRSSTPPESSYRKIAAIIRHGGDPYFRNRRGLTPMMAARTYETASACETWYKELNGSHANEILSLLEPLPNESLDTRLLESNTERWIDELSIV